MKFSRFVFAGTLAVLGAVAICWPDATAQTPSSGAQTKNPSAWKYADSFDAPAAAPESYKVRYEDNHVRFIEVTFAPGVKGKMAGHPWPSVFMRDAPRPKEANAVLDPASKQNGQDAGEAPPPASLEWPTCSTMGPQAPHATTNNDVFPDHFYRLDFKRIDSDGIATHWKEWYPHIVDAVHPPQPALLGKITRNPSVFRYNDAYDAPYGAPDVHKVRFEDDHVRLVEVGYKPGLQGNMHGHPWPSVFAHDSPGPVGPAPALDEGNVSRPNVLDVNAPEQRMGTGEGPAPAGLRYPTCQTMVSQAPHAPWNRGTWPNHFMRLEFKRIDGPAIKDNWRKWYPSLVAAK